MAARTAQSATAGSHEGAIYWMIAVLKLVKGVLLFAVGIGALSMLGKDVASAATHIINALSVDPHTRYVQSALAKLTRVDDRTLAEIGTGTFFYAALLSTEGIGLLMRQRWAEYFTIFVTASFVPLEIYELAQHVTATRVVVLLLNLGIVAYLAARVRRERAEKKNESPPARRPSSAGVVIALAGDDS
jgi:uncharacterized membrane protein (DUF2068 family)